MVLRMLRRLVAVLGSMRFAVGLLAVVCLVSVIGSVVPQGQPWVVYVDAYGLFWARVVRGLGLSQIYNTLWFMGLLAFLVLSTSVCLYRNVPRMWRQMRTFGEGIQRGALQAYGHRWSAEVSLSVTQAQMYIEQRLQEAGFRCKRVERSTGVLLASKKGMLNRLGYVFTHLAIVLVCLGGVFDSGLPLRLSMAWQDKQAIQSTGADGQVPPTAVLDAHTLSYRAGLWLPEGQRSALAVVNTPNGMVLQPLPFELFLKSFQVEFYHTGMPRVFASEVEVFDPVLQSRFAARIEVNKPLRYQGVTVYQSSFDDGGSRVRLVAVDLQRPEAPRVDLRGVVGQAQPLNGHGWPYQLELTGFKALSVEDLPTENAMPVRGLLGAALPQQGPTKPTNVGPSITYTLRDEAGQAKAFQNYMLPITLNGRSYFLLGVKDTPSADFLYVRVPADAQGSMDGFWRFRQALQSPKLRALAAERFAKTVQMPNADRALEARVTTSALQVLARFAGDTAGQQGGVLGLADMIEQSVPQAEQTKAAEAMNRLLQGALWAVYELSFEQSGLPPPSQTEAQQWFVQDAQVALSDLLLYDAPLVLQLSEFEEVRASVFQISKSPGQPLVYAGFLLLVLGVFLMFYVQDRRAFVWIRALPAGGCGVEMAWSSTRKTLAFEQEFEAFQATLNDWVDRGKHEQ